MDSGSKPFPNEAAERFLKPGGKERGKTEILKIIDFVNQIVQKEEEQILLDNGNNKLFLKGGPKKIKPEDISISQWVIGQFQSFDRRKQVCLNCRNAELSWLSGKRYGIGRKV